MDINPSPSDVPPSPWIGVALFSALWIGALAVVIRWWGPAAPVYNATVYVHGIPGSAVAGDAWLPDAKVQLSSDRELLQAAEATAGQRPSPAAAQLAAFRDALAVELQQDAASGQASLVLRYAGDLPQGPALVEALARRFASEQVPLPVVQRRSTLLAQSMEKQTEVKQMATAVDRLALQIESLEAALRENRLAVEASTHSADADPATLLALDRQQIAIDRQLVQLAEIRRDKRDRLESLRTESNRLADQSYEADQQYRAWSNATLWVKLADASPTGHGSRVWAVGLLVVLAVLSGSWGLACWGRGDRPLASAHQAEALLGVPVLAVECRT